MKKVKLNSTRSIKLKFSRSYDVILSLFLLFFFLIPKTFEEHQLTDFEC
jgi:hypothetical protein